MLDFNCAKSFESFRHFKKKWKRTFTQRRDLLDLHPRIENLCKDVIIFPLSPFPKHYVKKAQNNNFVEAAEGNNQVFSLPDRGSIVCVFQSKRRRIVLLR